MMLNNSYRKKLLHAVLYLTTKVKNPSKVKIFKLLYFLDFEHYRQTGQSVTKLYLSRQTKAEKGGAFSKQKQSLILPSSLPGNKGFSRNSRSCSETSTRSKFRMYRILKITPGTEPSRKRGS